jgi:hypothetical protein
MEMPRHRNMGGVEEVSMMPVSKASAINSRGSMWFWTSTIMRLPISASFLTPRLGKSPHTNP